MVELLECRFCLLPEWVSECLKGAKEKKLEAWGEAVLTAPTLEAVFKKSDVSKKNLHSRLALGILPTIRRLPAIVPQPVVSLTKVA